MVAAVAVNLSEGGALVELRKPLAELTGLVVVALELGGAPARLPAVVQRTETFRGKPRIGLSFLDIGEQQRHALRRLLRDGSER